MGRKVVNMKTVEFFFDFGSPTTYLAWQRLKQLSDQYDLEIDYKPMLLGGVFKATNNSSPVTVPAKGAYMLKDLARFAKRYNVPLNFNPNFPINTLALMRGAYGAQQLNCFDAYVTAIFEAMWVNLKNMSDPDVIGEVLSSAGLDASSLLATTQDPAIKQKLMTTTEEAIKRGAFGAPTLFMDGEMYFGQDRLDFIEEALMA